VRARARFAAQTAQQRGDGGGDGTVARAHQPGREGGRGGEARAVGVGHDGGANLACGGLWRPVHGAVAGARGGEAAGEVSGHDRGAKWCRVIASVWRSFGHNLIEQRNAREGGRELTGARQGARRRLLERLGEEGSEDGWCCVVNTVLERALL
jgi:hypothetical protein